MEKLEVTDPEARAEIENLKKEQYAQSERIKANRDCCEKTTKRLDATLPEHNRRIGDLERRFTDCDGKHESHSFHRRKSDQEMTTISATLNETLEVNRQTKETMGKLLKIVEEHAPTVKRAKDTHTWWDKSKEILILAAIIYGGLHGVEQIAAFFK